MQCGSALLVDPWFFACGPITPLDICCGVSAPRGAKSSCRMTCVRLPAAGIACRAARKLVACDRTYACCKMTVLPFVGDVRPVLCRSTRRVPVCSITSLHASLQTLCGGVVQCVRSSEHPCASGLALWYPSSNNLKSSNVNTWPDVVFFVVCLVCARYYDGSCRHLVWVLFWCGLRAAVTLVVLLLTRACVVVVAGLPSSLQLCPCSCASRLFFSSSNRA